MTIDLLRVRSETFIDQIDYHEQIESTNTHAMSMIQGSQISATPCLIIADQQTAGRGRSANRWWSDEGALTFTLVMEPPKSAPQTLPLYSLAVGLAVCEAVEAIAPDADLAVKWPNDVYANGRKLSGVLIEKPADGLLVIGIGINVNNRRDAAPPEVQQRSISVCDLVACETDRTALLIDVLSRLETRFGQLPTKRNELLDDWRKFDYLQGKQIELDAYGKIHRGEYLGINDDGSLRLVTSDGEQLFSGGVIGFV